MKFIRMQYNNEAFENFLRQKLDDVKIDSGQAEKYWNQMPKAPAKKAFIIKRTWLYMLAGVMMIFIASLVYVNQTTDTISDEPKKTETSVTYERANDKTLKPSATDQRQIQTNKNTSVVNTGVTTGRKDRTQSKDNKLTNKSAIKSTDDNLSMDQVAISKKPVLQKADSSQAIIQSGSDKIKIDPDSSTVQRPLIKPPAPKKPVHIIW